MAMPTEKTCYDGGEHDWQIEWCKRCGCVRYVRAEQVNTHIQTRIDIAIPTCHADYARRETEDAESQGDSEI